MWHEQEQVLAMNRQSHNKFPYAPYYSRTFIASRARGTRWKNVFPCSSWGCFQALSDLPLRVPWWATGQWKMHQHVPSGKQMLLVGKNLSRETHLKSSATMLVYQKVSQEKISYGNTCLDVQELDIYESPLLPARPPWYNWSKFEGIENLLGPSR